MDTYGQSTLKSDLYMSTSADLQPGLEVGAAPSRHTWPWSRQKADWGTEQKQTASLERRQIAGLSVDTFWALVVLLCIIVAGGIGGGVGAGLAAQKSNCER